MEKFTLPTSQTLHVCNLRQEGDRDIIENEVNTGAIHSSCAINKIDTFGKSLEKDRESILDELVIC